MNEMLIKEIALVLPYTNSGKKLFISEEQSLNSFAHTVFLFLCIHVFMLEVVKCVKNDLTLKLLVLK